jgi:hypothetical protein
MLKEFEEWLNDRPNYKKLTSWNPSLTQNIIDCHTTPENKVSGFIPQLVVGKPGSGKSTFCYKFMAKLWWTIKGYTDVSNEEECYKWSLDNMIYRPSDLFNRVLQQRDLSEPAWIWCLDDCSVHMGRQLFDQDRETYRKLQGIVPTLREDVTCLLITTPTPNLLAKPFREFFNSKINMQIPYGIKAYKRLGKHYEKWYYPDDVHYRIFLACQDKFSCEVPEPFYSWYLLKKRTALKDYAISIVKKSAVVDSGEEEGEPDDKP